MQKEKKEGENAFESEYRGCPISVHPSYFIFFIFSRIFPEEARRQIRRGISSLAPRYRSEYSPAETHLSGRNEYDEGKNRYFVQYS